MRLIEDISQRYEGTRSKILPEDLAQYFGATADLYMYLQGTLMGLQKVNMLVRRECHAIESIWTIPLESVDAPIAVMMDLAVDALCWIGCYTRCQERTELCCKLSEWRCGPLDVKAFPFDSYFDCLVWGQAERESFKLGLFYVLYLTGQDLHMRETQMLDEC